MPSSPNCAFLLVFVIWNKVTPLVMMNWGRHLISFFQKKLIDLNRRAGPVWRLEMSTIKDERPSSSEVLDRQADNKGECSHALILSQGSVIFNSLLKSSYFARTSLNMQKVTDLSLGTA